MPITNGTISILRRVRTGDFEHIEPHVTLTFSIEAGEDAEAVANGTRMIVDAQYKHLLGIAVEPDKKTRTKAEKPTPLPEAAPSTPGPVASIVPLTTAPASPPSTPSVPPSPGAAFNAAGQPGPTAPVAPPAAVIAPAPVVGPSTQTPTAVVPQVAPAPVVPAAGPTESAIGPVSDEMMAKRCQDKTDELNALYEPGVGLQKVVALIRQYISPPGRATQIPHESREAFLTNLTALA